MRRALRVLILGAVCHLTATRPATAEARLVVYEIEGCAYCAEFRRVVLPAYWGSRQAAEMPIEIVDLNALGTNGHALRHRLDVVPTFVVIDDGREIGRIEGYPGRDNLAVAIEVVLRAVRQR